MKSVRYSSKIIMGAALTAAILIPTLSSKVHAGEEVNVYSYRQPFLVKPLFDAFTQKSGIKVNVIFAKKGMVEKIKAEGANSPADVLLTVDISRLSKAVMSGVSQTITSPVLTANIPAEYRDAGGHWFGLTKRARVVYASNERVAQKAITYEELADPKWKGKICIRSGQHVYNRALFASMIAHHGEEKAENWLKGFKANLARKPKGNDRKQVKAVFAGECDISIGNTYYMGKMQTNKKNPEQQEWAKSVRILFPNTNDRGAHINVSGALVAKYAPHKANAIKLIEWLTSDKAQKIYAEVNHEYPVKKGIATSDLVKSWGAFKSDTLSLTKIADFSGKATKMVDKVNFNN